MAIIPKGCEPENVQKRIELLFSKLDATYPDSVIHSLQRDHKKWAETALEIARQLGYENGNEFLTAYGYTIERVKAGRHSSTDAAEVIAELKRRYPNGMPFSKVSEVEKANPDLKGKLKTIQNNADNLFGMSLKDYLLEQGLFCFGDKKSQLDNLLDQLKRRYPEGSDLPATLAGLKAENDDLPVNRLVFIKDIYGVTVKDYLQQISLLPPEVAPSGPVDPKSGRYIQELPTDEANEAYLRLLKNRYKDKVPLPTMVSELSAQNPDIPVRRLNKYLREKGEKKAEHYYIKNGILKGEDTDLLTYTYCMVSFENSGRYGIDDKQFAYLAGEGTYAIGDIVVAELGYSGYELGKVKNVIRCLGIDGPWHPARTKTILRKALPEEIIIGEPIEPEELERYRRGEAGIAYRAGVCWNEDIDSDEDAEDSLLGFVPTDSQQFEEIIGEDLRGNEWVACEFRFRGLLPEIARFKRYLRKEAQLSFEEFMVSEQVREIRVCADKQTMDLIEKFPALKVTGLVEHWFQQEVYVAFSESGFAAITDFADGAPFDRRHDGGDGRWEWEYDMMKPVDVRFRWLQTGYSQRVHYRYPFKDKWNQNDYTREVNGVIYVREDGGSN